MSDRKTSSKASISAVDNISLASHKGAIGYIHWINASCIPKDIMSGELATVHCLVSHPCTMFQGHLQERPELILVTRNHWQTTAVADAILFKEESWRARKRESNSLSSKESARSILRPLFHIQALSATCAFQPNSASCKINGYFNFVFLLFTFYSFGVFDTNIMIVFHLMNRNVCVCVFV